MRHRHAWRREGPKGRNQGEQSTQHQPLHARNVVTLGYQRQPREWGTLQAISGDSPMPSKPTDHLPRSTQAAPAGFRELMTTERWLEVGRIVGVWVVILLYRGGLVPLPVLLAAVAVGLYPLVKTGVLDLVHEHKIGTEIFVTIATGIAMLGGEYVAGAILMTIILIAEFIAD